MPLWHETLTVDAAVGAGEPPARFIEALQADSVPIQATCYTQDRIAAAIEPYLLKHMPRG